VLERARQIVDLSESPVRRSQIVARKSSFELAQLGNLSSLAVFGLLSLGVFSLALVTTFIAFVDTTEMRLVNYSTVVMPAVAVLAYCLSFYLLMMGLLCELALRSSAARETAYAPMARIEEVT